MANTIYQYRVYCEDEQSNISGWSENPTEVCLNNNTHIVTSGSLTIIDELSDDVVKSQIIEEDIPTGGHFQCKATAIHSTASGVLTVDLSWPFPISLLSAELLVCSGGHGDYIEALIGPDTVIGVLTAAAASGSTELEVSPTVIENTAIGFFISIAGQDLGRVLAIGDTAIIVENEVSIDITAGNYVLQTVKMLTEFDLGLPGRITIGDTKVGASRIPANTILRYTYYNSNGQEKELIAMLEYLY